MKLSSFEYYTDNFRKFSTDQIVKDVKETIKIKEVNKCIENMELTSDTVSWDNIYHVVYARKDCELMKKMLLQAKIIHISHIFDLAEIDTYQSCIDFVREVVMHDYKFHPHYDSRLNTCDHPEFITTIIDVSIRSMFQNECKIHPSFLDCKLIVFIFQIVYWVILGN